MTDTELRWLSCQGYVLGAREVTQPEDEVRSYRPSHNLSFDKRTCFVLTDAGESFVRSQSEPFVSADMRRCRHRKPRPRCPRPKAIPRRCLFRYGMLRGVNCAIRVGSSSGIAFRRNQALILTAFQEEGWPQYIDDPLPPAGEQDPKHRLQATVKSLNRNQQAAVIRFHGNGNGLQVFWEAVEAD